MRVCRKVAAVAAVFAVMASGAQAATLASQPLDGVSGFFSDVDCQSCPEGIQVLADDFSLSTPINGIGRLTFFGAFFPDNVLLSNMLFDVRILGDDQGLPDNNNVVFTGVDLTPTFLDTGTDVFGLDAYQVDIDLNTDPLNAGAFFLEIVGDTTGSNDQWTWLTGSQDPVAGQPGSAFNTTGGVDAIWEPIEQDLAFTLMDRMTTVPAPAPFLMLLGGLAFFGYTKRRSVLQRASRTGAGDLSGK